MVGLFSMTSPRMSLLPCATLPGAVRAAIPGGLHEHRIRLVCWHCGSARVVLTAGPPQFGFELAGWAKDAGMVGYQDLRYGRVLIFCNADHARQQMTKGGMFRRRPKI